MVLRVLSPRHLTKDKKSVNIRRKITAASLLVAVFVLFSVFVGSSKSTAQSSGDWGVDSFTADYYINPDADGSMDIDETIEVHFNIQKHGIYRNIPSNYDGGVFNPGTSLNTKLKSITDGQSGAPLLYEQDKSSGYLNLTIGDPGIYIIGDHVYKVSYSVDNAVRFFDNHDELYWDVNGTDWQVSMGAVSARIFVPEGLQSKVTDLKCFTGGQGSKASDCVISYDVTSGTVKVSADRPLSNYENLSYVVAFEKGSFTPPSIWDKWGGKNPPHLSQIDGGVNEPFSKATT